ncbi:hypothetical protein VP01_526g10 [Puccinia sorghi]|uniref:Uncharacterized protein n=1 Tax=Puccinia sorghi TaxID=27349 RepID=A0A0L6UL63_9BASI|nr:hypothetical protein VP01_526g10 [Puccinia sorghi]
MIKLTNLFFCIYMLCQTTDSGSNNNTMAETMHNKFQNLEGTLDLEWNYQTMHIKHFSHNIALVVNAGLNKLVLEALAPPKLKKSFLSKMKKTREKKETMRKNLDDPEIN